MSFPTGASAERKGIYLPLNTMDPLGPVEAEFLESLAGENRLLGA
jgi:hypothetical protein